MRRRGAVVASQHTQSRSPREIRAKCGAGEAPIAPRRTSRGVVGYYAAGRRAPAMVAHQSPNEGGQAIPIHLVHRHDRCRQRFGVIKNRLFRV